MMWKKRAKQTTLIAIGLLVVSIAVLAWLWSDRPHLEDIGWPAPTIASSAVADSVTVTWLGVTTLLFDDSETQILIDGFFSRPSLADVVLGRPVKNDAAIINYVLNEYRMRRLAAIIPVHSHFDRGAGVPEDQITTVIENQPYEFGRFTVTLLPSRHAPIGWRGSVPFAGTIDAPLTLPQPVSAWREGGSYTIVIAHPQGTTVVQASAGLANASLSKVPADVVILGVAGLESLGRSYAERYWQGFVTATGASSVYPVHFDDYTKPFGEVVPGPKFLGDLTTTAEWFEGFRRQWDNDAQLFMPEFGRPIALYAQPVPEG
jgi:L-ascorbate metabolism protein UlaG (beta-lactamase superfamily)